LDQEPVVFFKIRSFCPLQQRGANQGPLMMRALSEKYAELRQRRRAGQAAGRLQLSCCRAHLDHDSHTSSVMMTAPEVSVDAFGAAAGETRYHDFPEISEDDH
jgi:hypothetical protein